MNDDRDEGLAGPDRHRCVSAATPVSADIVRYNQLEKDVQAVCEGLVEEGPDRS